jgi:uncharacterized membrane protein
MIINMKPLFVLLIAFGISLLVTKLFNEEPAFSLSGRIAMSFMLMFTAFGHFAFSKGMAAMLPEVIPLKVGIIYFTGVIEIAAAIGLLIFPLKHLTSWMLIIFFLSILPANINAAIKRIDYQKGTGTGNGVQYLWFRVPLQLFFIGWVYYFGIYLNR